MNIYNFILKNKNLETILFLKKLLAFEKNRIDDYFKQREALSYYEEINENFGIFPSKKLYPMYFYGEIDSLKNKYVFIGMNPSYIGKREELETEMMGSVGYFDWLNNAFRYWNESYNGILFSYAKKIPLFLHKIGEIKDKKIVDYNWLQDNVVNLEFIPYPSQKADGLSINNLTSYKETYFEVLRKMILHLKPKKPIVIFGLKNLDFLKKEFIEGVEINESLRDNNRIYYGKLFGYDFVCLNFRFGIKDIEHARDFFYKK